MTAGNTVKLARAAQKRLRSAVKNMSAGSSTIDPLDVTELRSRLHELEVASAPLLEAIEEMKGALAAADHERVRLAQEDPAQPTWARSTPAVSDPKVVLEWLAQSAFDAGHSARYTLLDRGGVGDRVAHAAAAVAQIKPGPLIGGTFGIDVARAWPRNPTGGRKSLGVAGISLLIGGKAGQEFVTARVEDLRLAKRQYQKRRDLIETVAHTVLQDKRVANDFLWRSFTVADSDQGLQDAMSELADMSGNPQVAHAHIRHRLVDQIAGSSLGAGRIPSVRRAATVSVVQLIHLLEEASRARGGDVEIDLVVRQLTSMCAARGDAERLDGSDGDSGGLGHLAIST